MDKKHKKETIRVCGVLSAFILAAILGQLLVSCSPRMLPPAEVKDSVRVEIRERVVHDTAIVEIPMIREVSVTRDSSSHLENAYASSEASITGGLLHHTLESRPQRIYVPVEVAVHDTTVVEKKAETIVKEVPAQISKWQAFQMILGRILGIALLVCMAYAAYRLIMKYR